jgi:hypothetical protein
VNRASWILVASAGVLVAISACTMLDRPVQCASDDDCARFDARCDLDQSVCVPKDVKTTKSAPLPSSRVNPTNEATPPAPSSAPTTVAAALSADAGAPGATPSDGGLQGLVATVTCGATACPVAADSVCCITGGVATCTTRAACTANTYARCDEAADCAALGFDAGTVCCGFNDGANPPALTKARCVPAAQCDANGPQDALCKVDGPAGQCDISGDGRTKCAPFTYSNTTDYAFCVTP